MDMVTVIGLVAAGGMFIAGVSFVAFGLRRQSQPLPHGAEDILSAVAEGRLRPAGTNYTDRGPVPSRLTKQMPPAEPPLAEPAVRLIPRPGSPARPAPTPAPVPVGVHTAVVPGPPRPAASDPAAVPVAATASTSEDAFFAAGPRLRRF